MFVERDEKVAAILQSSSSHADMMSRIESQGLLVESNAALRAADEQYRERISLLEQEVAGALSRQTEAENRARDSDAARTALESEMRQLRQEAERGKKRIESLMAQFASSDTNLAAELESKR